MDRDYKDRVKEVFLFGKIEEFFVKAKREEHMGHLKILIDECHRRMWRSNEYDLKILAYPIYGTYFDRYEHTSITEICITKFPKRKNPSNEAKSLKIICKEIWFPIMEAF